MLDNPYYYFLGLVQLRNSNNGIYRIHITILYVIIIKNNI